MILKYYRARLSIVVCVLRGVPLCNTTQHCRLNAFPYKYRYHAGKYA